MEKGVDFEVIEKDDEKFIPFTRVNTESMNGEEEGSRSKSGGSSNEHQGVIQTLQGGEMIHFNSGEEKIQYIAALHEEVHIIKEKFQKLYNIVSENEEITDDKLSMSIVI